LDIQDASAKQSQFPRGQQGRGLGSLAAPTARQNVRNKANCPPEGAGRGRPTLNQVEGRSTKSRGPVAPNKPNLPIADCESGTKLRRDAPRGRLHEQTQLAGPNYAKRSQFATRGAGTAGTNRAKRSQSSAEPAAAQAGDADATGVPHAPSGCSGEFACLGRRGRVALWLRDRMVPC
jgi:hypothetical protein